MFLKVISLLERMRSIKSPSMYEIVRKLVMLYEVPFNARAAQVWNKLTCGVASLNSILQYISYFKN